MSIRQLFHQTSRATAAATTMPRRPVSRVSQSTEEAEEGHRQGEGIIAEVGMGEEAMAFEVGNGEEEMVVEVGSGEEEW